MCKLAVPSCPGGSRYSPGEQAIEIRGLQKDIDAVWAGNDRIKCRGVVDKARAAFLCGAIGIAFGASKV